MDKYNTNRSLLSSIFPENPYNTTGLTDRTPTNQHKAAISSLSVNFGRISQNDANFAARVHSLTAQKTQKTKKPQPVEIAVVLSSQKRSL